MSSGEYKHLFLLGVHLGAELLGNRDNICLALVNTTRLPKLLCTFMIPLAIRGSSGGPTTPEANLKFIALFDTLA